MIFIQNRLDWEETYSHTIFWPKIFCQKFLHVQKFLPEISKFSILMAFGPSEISGRNFCQKLVTSLKKHFSKTSLKHISDLCESINKPLSYWNSRKFLKFEKWAFFSKKIVIFRNFENFENMSNMKLF